MKSFHVLLIPIPAQGHVSPLLEVARCLTSNGIKVTFVNTDFNHKRVMSASSHMNMGSDDLMQMVSIPDGIDDPLDDRSDLAKLVNSMLQVMPTKLEELIQSINQKDDKKITCIIADSGMGWFIKVAQKLGIRSAIFCPHAASLLVPIMSIQKLMDDGVIDNNGVPLTNQMVQLSPSIPPMDPTKFSWVNLGDSATNKVMFQRGCLNSKEAIETTDKIICNSTIDLEPGVFTTYPNILPIGPLLACNKSTKQVGHFWKEDSTCVAWLDQQQVCSVIYVAFGSFTIFNQSQFEEVALGLELTNKSFLWVVRPGTSSSTEYVYPSGYMERVGTRGKIVSWAPQQEVLKHPSVACFFSHCGWNSTLEGVSNGVPFVCWPYFGDHNFNATCICDIWKTGVGLNKDDTGIVTREEIKSIVKYLLGNKMLKDNALNLQEKVTDSLKAGKSSNENLHNFIDWIKEGNEKA